MSQEVDAYALWKKPKDMYQSKIARNKALLAWKLVSMKLRSGMSVAEHTSEFQNVVNQMFVVELNLDDEMQALLLLSSLLDNWDTVVVTCNN